MILPRMCPYMMDGLVQRSIDDEMQDDVTTTVIQSDNHGWKPEEIGFIFYENPSTDCSIHQQPDKAAIDVQLQPSDDSHQDEDCQCMLCKSLEHLTEYLERGLHGAYPHPDFVEFLNTIQLSTQSPPIFNENDCISPTSQ